MSKQRRRKVAIIDNCADCPHHTETSSYTDFCHHTKMKEITNPFDIPDWCPLLDDRKKP